MQLSNKPDELIRRGCAAALCNLSYEVGSEKAIVKAGGVACLLIIALVATDNADTKVSTDHRQARPHLNLHTCHNPCPLGSASPCATSP